MKKNLKTKGKKKNARYFPKNREITATSRKRRRRRKTNAEKAIQNILIEKGFTRQELDNPETRLLSIIERRIQKKEDILKEIKVESLSFNSFYEFPYALYLLFAKRTKLILILLTISFY